MFPSSWTDWQTSHVVQLQQIRSRIVQAGLEPGIQRARLNAQLGDLPHDPRPDAGRQLGQRVDQVLDLLLDAIDFVLNALARPRHGAPPRSKDIERFLLVRVLVFVVRKHRSLSQRIRVAGVAPGDDNSTPPCTTR